MDGLTNLEIWYLGLRILPFKDIFPEKVFFLPFTAIWQAFGKITFHFENQKLQSFFSPLSNYDSSD